ncbi:MAG TPA: hypothetical protein VF627_00445 [Abditibacterium sp.]
MSRFRVQFAQVEHGWAHAVFEVEEKTYDFQFSRVVYGDAFARLCEALGALAEENWPQTVTWMGEPQQYEVRFSKTADEIQLEMWRFEGHERSLASAPELEFAVSGTYDEICLPLWRALRTLQGLYSESAFKIRWRYEFPTRELAHLTELLGKT